MMGKRYTCQLPHKEVTTDGDVRSGKATKLAIENFPLES